MSRKSVFMVGGIVTTLAVVGGVIYYRRCKRLNSLKKKVNQLMQILDQPNITIRDPASLRGILSKLVSDGADKLQVLSDFDKTISKFWVDGKLGESCHGVIEKASCMPVEFREKVAAAKAKYYPLEMSPDLSKEEKVPLMVEWWTQIHDAMIETGVKKEWLQGMVSEALIELRDGTREFLEYLLQRRIPLVVFSAGVGDVIEEVIASADCPLSGLKIISNYMDFDAEGNLVGFRTELIHSYNKHDISVHWSDYFDKTRPNDILLGDTIGDTSMADGLGKGGTTLKIAFLNDKVDTLLDQFSQAYDIVITDDQTFDTITVFCKELLG